MKNILTILCFVSLATGCATNPVTGKTELMLVGEDTEIGIGQQQYVPAQQSQGGQYVVDEKLTAYVSSVGHKLAAVSDRDLPYEFVVLNNSVPNAWALPGGKIAINRGLLLSLENEAELAAVLGHEIVHSAARHGAKAMERNMLYQGALLVTSVASSDSDYSNYIVGGAQLGAQLLTQGYSRGAELEADHIGMEYMARAGYDPHGAVTLQEKFLALSNGKSPGWLEGLFASHPPSAERVQLNKENEPRIMAEKGRMDWKLGAAEYRNKLAYLTSKADAYKAFDQAAALQKEEPATALARLSQAISIEPNEPRFYGLKADILFRQAKYGDAIPAYDQALARHANYYQYYLGRGLAYSKLGDRVKARADLERSIQLLPTAMAMNELGNLSLAAGNRNAAKQYFESVMKSQGNLAEQAQRSFIELDVVDNPAPYFPVVSTLENGEFTSLVTNQSGLNVNGVDLAFSATINGKRYETVRTTGHFAPRSQLKVLPGWKIGETDLVEYVSVRAVRVR